MKIATEGKVGTKSYLLHGQRMMPVSKTLFVLVSTDLETEALLLSRNNEGGRLWKVNKGW